MSSANNREDGALGHLASLKRLVYFAAVVETGSFTAAAERLGITKAVVSQQVARLERDLHVTLLTRTTRSVKTTDAGRAFHERCSRLLHDAADAFDELAETTAEPTGTLRLTAPVDYGLGIVVPAIAEFARRYPGCSVNASLSDKTLDLIDSDFELAIRVGWLKEMHLQARQIGSFRQLLVASSAWQSRARRITRPEQIASLPFVAHAAFRDAHRWTFSRKGADDRSVAVRPAIVLDATLGVREAVKEGAGLSVLPDYVVAEDLGAGRLVQVLPHWSLPSGGIHVVFPAARFRPAKVRAFVDLLAERERRRVAR